MSVSRLVAGLCTIQSVLLSAQPVLLFPRTGRAPYSLPLPMPGTEGRVLEYVSEYADMKLVLMLGDTYH